MQNLKDCIRNCFIRALFSGYDCNDLERQLFELPAKHGSLGLINPSEKSDPEYRNSKRTSEEGTSLIKKQQHIYRIDQQKQNIVKLNIRSDKNKECEEQLNSAKHQMEDEQHHKVKIKLIDASSEPTTYNWLTTISLEKHSFHLGKSTVLDSLNVLPYS